MALALPPTTFYTGSMVDYTVRVNRAAAETLESLSAQLSAGGLRLARTFDLHATRLGSADHPCPIHGAARCDCDYSVLLLYRPCDLTRLPGVIVAHQHDGATWLDLLPLPWHDPAALEWRARITDAMVAAVFAGEPSEKDAA